MTEPGTGLQPHHGGVPVPNAAVMEELRRVRAICDTARAVAQTLEAQLMESLWKIRQELGGDRTRFIQLLHAHTDQDPDRAWLMAETWESGRKNRDLRALASQKPHEALALVSQFVDEGLSAELHELGDNDHDAARLVSLPPRKRTAKIRELIAEAKAAKTGHHPADLERIRAAEAERDAAVEELDRERQLKLGEKTPERQALNQLRDVEKRLAQAMEAVRPQLPAASTEFRDEARRVSEMLWTAIERLHSEIYVSDDQAMRGQDIP